MELTAGQKEVIKKLQKLERITLWYIDEVNKHLPANEGWIEHGKANIRSGYKALIHAMTNLERKDETGN